MPKGNCQRPPGHYDRFNFVVATPGCGVAHMDLTLYDPGGGSHPLHSGPWQVTPMGVSFLVGPVHGPFTRVEAHVQLDNGRDFYLDYTAPAPISSIVAGVEESMGNLVPFAVLYMENCDGVVPPAQKPELYLT